MTEPTHYHVADGSCDCYYLPKKGDTWPPKTDEEKRAHLARQIQNDPTMKAIESNAPAPPPEEPVTDEEKAKARAEKLKALAFLETFHPGWRAMRRPETSSDAS